MMGRREREKERESCGKVGKPGTAISGVTSQTRARAQKPNNRLGGGMDIINCYVVSGVFTARVSTNGQVSWVVSYVQVCDVSAHPIVICTDREWT